MAALSASTTTALREYDAYGERVIPVNPDLVLIASKSEPGAWHVVEHINGHPLCTCPGFTFRGVCRHVKVANDVVADVLS